MKIYISLPITGFNLDERTAYAKSIADKIKQQGHEPVSPLHDVPTCPDNITDEKERYAYYMGEDIKQLIMCDAILLCKGWQHSRGCNIERKVAFQMGMKTLKSIDEL